LLPDYRAARSRNGQGRFEARQGDRPGAGARRLATPNDSLGRLRPCAKGLTKPRNSPIEVLSSMQTPLARCGWWLSCTLLVGGVGFWLLDRAPAGGPKKERDLYDYEAQKSAAGVKKIVFVADTAPHGPRGNHEFLAAAIYCARTINAHYPKAYAVVHTQNKWPKHLKHADAIVVLLNHGGSAVNAAVKEATARGAGFMAIHYGVEVNKGEQGQHYLRWMGGYFETFWSVNPWWTPEFKDLPRHEVTRGVKPFAVNDEWYYHMRFAKGMKGVTPILHALPPLKTIQGGGKGSSPPSRNPTASY